MIINKRLIVILSICLATIIGVFGIRPPTYVYAATGKAYVKQMIKKINKQYPDGSTFNRTIEYYDPDDDVTYTYGGCNGFVAYFTQKTFGDVYTQRYSDGYRNKGSVSTSNTRKMKKLFKKAKIGDPIMWYTGGDCRHVAIFMSYSEEGIRVYEANFGGKNKVRYNHLWPWNHMKDWPAGGAKKVTVSHYKKYNKLGD